MKRKLVQRMMAASLTVVVIMSLTACGGGDDTADNTVRNDVAATNSNDAAPSANAQETSSVASTEEKNADESGWEVLTDENGNPYDLGGMEIIIRDWWTEDKPMEINNAYDEAHAEYLDWIQETYNFTIKRVAISDWGSVPEDFVNYATTGGDENYLFTLRSGSELVSAMRSGLMYDLSTLDSVDFSEDKWSKGVMDAMTYKGGVYGMYGETPEPKGGMYFNKRLLEEAGINPEDLYTYQENMEWTWDKFEELCQQVAADTDNDGVIDRYAMANFTSCFYPFAVYSNGGEFIGKDEDSQFYNALESDETLEALNWALDMIDKYEMTYPADANWDYWLTAYMNGEACFMADEVYRAGQMEDMEDDFGFVCFPMGPKASDYVNIHSDNPICIPACYDEQKAWNLAFAYNLYTNPVPGYEDYEAWKSNYLQSFRDTESIDLTIARLIKNGKSTYHLMVPGLDLGADLIWALNKDNTPAQQAETIRPTWAAYLEELNK